MKIINKTKSTVAFAAVEQGEVFAYGEHLYMKVGAGYNDENCEICNTNINAVYLPSGILTHFEDNDRVILVDAQLVIGGN